MKMEVKLPHIYEVSDYHDFDSLRNIFSEIIRGVKVKEIGFCGTHYTGIAYVGSLSDPQNAKCMKEVKERIKVFEEGERELEWL